MEPQQHALPMFDASSHPATVVPMTKLNGTLGLTYAGLGVLGAQSVPAIASRAQDLGYSSFWTAEANGTDAFTLLAAASVAAPSLDLGTGVAPIQLRSPALATMSAASLQALAPEQTVHLGVGISTPVIVERWHSADYSTKPIAHMREYLTLVRELLSGENVTFEGDFYSVKRFRLGVRLGDRRPLIALAALNPQMLRLGGELADAVLLNYLPSSYVAESVSEIRKGGDAKIFAYVHAAVSDFDEFVESARRDLFGYAVADGYARMFTAAGFGEEVAELRARHKDRDREGAVAAISEAMVQAINFIGSSDEVSSFVDAYAEAGVDQSILMVMPWGSDRRAVVQATMEAAIG